MYIYRQVMGTHTQQGIVALANIEDYEQNKIKKLLATQKIKQSQPPQLVIHKRGTHSLGLKTEKAKNKCTFRNHSR